uniref:Reverse transcriptase domain-containing protein n=1 Tax=Tanacetum cinerariifolium TaxID=118510 RepID=A0A6L2M5Y3_TANCI|nr:hypothetical protein [Tanacetum cinerariifolium]
MVFHSRLVRTRPGRKEDSNEVQAVSFYPRTEFVEPLEWKALENWLKPSSIKPPRLELKELPEHLEYAFLQENNQLPVVISSALSTVEKARLLEGGMTIVKNEKNKLIPQRTVTGWRHQEKTIFTCPYETFAYKRMPFRLCNAPTTFQRYMTAIFHEPIEDSMEKGVKNLATDHLSRLVNPDLGKLTKAKIRDLFPKERLMAVFDKNNEPCGPSRGHHGIATTARKVFEAGFYWPHIFRDTPGWSKFLMYVNEPTTSLQGIKHLKSTSKSAKYLMFGE